MAYKQVHEAAYKTTMKNKTRKFIQNKVWKITNEMTATKLLW